MNLADLNDLRRRYLAGEEISREQMQEVVIAIRRSRTESAANVVAKAQGKAESQAKSENLLDSL